MRRVCVRALARQLLQLPVRGDAHQQSLSCGKGILSCLQFAASKHHVPSSWQVFPATSQVRTLYSCSGSATSLLHCNNPKCWQLEQRRSIIADRETKALTIWKDLKHIRSSPLPALVLGFSGLIPFVTPPVYMIYAQTFMPQLVFAELAYGACILSFLGGVRWGFVIPEGSEQRADWLNLGYSVAPSLVAWVGLMMPVSFGILTVMGGIAGAAYFDATMRGYPLWFKALRFMLSLGAVLSLWTAYLCQYVIKEKVQKEAEAPAEQTE